VRDPICSISCARHVLSVEGRLSATLHLGRREIYNIVDDEPAALREWLPVLANVLGARPPFHIPVWLARLIAGESAVMVGTSARGASNAKAKREFGWVPHCPSWRQGFVAAYASRIPAEKRKRPSVQATSHSPSP
jgi:nucleoside-diphosphate-sugar epimerase